MMVFKIRIVLGVLALAAITSCTAKTKATLVYGPSPATSQMSADQSEFYMQLQADLIVEGLSESQAAALIQNLTTAELRSLTLSALAADKMSESKILAITARVAALLPSFAAADAQTVVAALTRTVTHSSIKKLGTNVSSTVMAALVSAAETVPGTSESSELLQRMLKGANAAITALQLEASQTQSAFGSFAGNLIVESVNIQTTASGVSTLMTSLTSTFISEVLTAGLPSEMFTGAMNALNAALASTTLKTASVSADDFASTLVAGIVAATVGSADKLPSTLVSAFVNQTSVGMLKVAAPTFSVAAGGYAAAQSVTLATTTSDATIYYTVDGTTPTTASTLYSGAITVSSTETVKAYGVKTNYTDSSVASALYTIIAYTTPASVPDLSYANATGTSGIATLALSVSATTLEDNGAPVTACSVKSGTPALPAGLAVDPQTCKISGTPSASLPPTVFTIVASNSVGNSNDAKVTFEIKSIGDIPGLRIWLRADDAASVTRDVAGMEPSADSEVVARWSDGSGNANHFRVFSTRPILLANGINGKPAVKFSKTPAGTGTTLCLSSGGGACSVLFNAKRTLITVFQVDANTDYWQSIYSSRESGLLWDSFTTFGLGAPGVADADLTFFKNGKSSPDEDSVILYPGATGPLGRPLISVHKSQVDAQLVLYLGGSLGHWIPFVGRIAQFLVFDRILNEDEIAVVTRTLSAKYGIELQGTGDAI